MISSVYIAKNVYGGDGMGRLGDGRVIFVPGAWEGEQVKAEITVAKKNFVKARLVEVEEVSPDREEPGRTVPGMVYAGLAFKAENRIKRQQLDEALARARIDHPEIVTISTEQALNYRNKAVYHFEGTKIGYLAEPEHRVVEVEQDPLVLPAINAALPEIRQNVKALLTLGAKAVRDSIARKASVTVRYSPKSGVKWWLGDDVKDTVMLETTLGKSFEVPAGGFYQVNPEAGERLVQAVRQEYLNGKDSAPNVLDLYCGVGVFGICCEPPRLTGIESGRAAIDFALKNADRARQPAAFYAEEVGRNMRRIGIGSQTCVIVDPPRDGLEKGVAEWLARSKAPRIIYVSCDPATLVRDLRVMTRTYAVETVKWVNMFPRTARFETMVTLRKRQA